MAENVGLIVVHGIGEQGRFEHLDGHVRGVINGLKRNGFEVTVEIQESPVAAFQAQQGSWRAGPHPALRIVARGKSGEKHIQVHEVWWADVNERYSVMKQVRFWLWGLAIWAYPPRYSIDLPTKDVMFPPRAGRKTARERFHDQDVEGEETSTAAALRKEWKMRAQLFLTGSFFLLASFSVGIGTTILKRLLNIEPPNLVRIFANYLSSVKLYNQRHRRAPGWSGKHADFLDAIGNPPRVSIRRRMIRTIADVACRDYDRWYILAHSQGAVVAFNGLMEPAFGWPGYLDAKRWRSLCAKKMAGGAATTMPDAKGMMPPRPAWVSHHDIVYRTRVFARFRGLLTYGSPLEKFAAIWPATIAVCREPAFQEGTRWINVYDPLDLVSGMMKSWPTHDHACSPPFENIGYAAGPWLLAGHTAYLDCPDPASDDRPRSPRDLVLADGVALWIANDDGDAVHCLKTSRLFRSGDTAEKYRNLNATVQTFIVTMFITGLFAVALKLVLSRFFPFLGKVTGLSDPGNPTQEPWLLWQWSAFSLFLAIILPLGFGAFSRWKIGVISHGERPPDVAFSAVTTPDPSPISGS